MNKAWKCRNAGYLTHFLNEYVGEVVIDSPDEVHMINDNVEKRIYYVNRTKKIIFIEKRERGIELFTNGTWY